MRTNRKGSYLKYLAFSLVIILVGIILGYLQITPSKAPKNKEERITLSEVPSDEADFSMVLSHVYHMSKKVHPSGSNAIKETQQYLVQQLDTIGCDYQTQEFEVDLAPTIAEKIKDYTEYMKTHPEESAPFDEYLRKLGFSSYEEKVRFDFGCTEKTLLPFTNYLVKLDAPNREEGVLFVSHYDSTSGGPGASDDLIGVASMLEALREASHYEALQNDIYFLFTDGEELELYGSDKFVNSYPSLEKQIKLVINLEARGTSGSLYMFETSLQNKNVIKTLNKALDQNVMFSFTTAVYRLMPNDTDLTNFLESGYSGINFAMIGNPENYHTQSDNYDNMNRDSAYMYHRTASNLAKYFSNSNLSELDSKEDAVYFPLLKGNNVVASNQFMQLLSYALGAISLLWIGFLLVRKEVRPKNLLFTCAKLLLSLILAAILGFLCSFIYSKLLTPGNFASLTSQLSMLFYSFCFLLIILTLSVIWILMKRNKDSQDLLIGVMLMYNIINWVCTILFNSLAYIFLIPLGLMFLYSLYLHFSKGREKNKLISYLYVILSSIILCLLFTPIVSLVYTALLDTAILALIVIVTLGVLPITALSMSLVIKNKRNEVQE